MFSQKGWCWCERKKLEISKGKINKILKKILKILGQLPWAMRKNVFCNEITGKINENFHIFLGEKMSFLLKFVETEREKYKKVFFNEMFDYF